MCVCVRAWVCVCLCFGDEACVGVWVCAWLRVAALGVCECVGGCGCGASGRALAWGWLCVGVDVGRCGGPLRVGRAVWGPLG